MPSPEHDEIVALIRASADDPTAVVGFDEARARLDSLGAIFAVPDGVEITPAELAGVRVERFRPSGAVGPGSIQYHHGGSYIGGSLDSHRPLTARLAAATGREVVAVDYRLAPEHPFPAGLDDARAVHRHLVDVEGIDPAQLVVAGDSAGGGLTAALTLALRDDGSAPAGAVLLSPWLDLTLTNTSITELADDDPMLTADALARAAEAYAGGRLKEPLVSPVFGDLAGLPPMLVLVGTAEILLDDSRTFAERATAAGSDVDLDVHEGLIHVWPFVDGIPESAAALRRIADWIDATVGA
ncbi:alpha/beta hydrolase [Dermatobacter hominis]|uniref:alpha/beta hydrolase n=1 Tax=Dermatobacter hominis TaxID=2884263 RepID=UPI001D13021B|nr:alpha/beta hydrolase [Dermatobacter hominis]UDY37052.1 alpha/beta hydrolase [Dermatobacter hominis]